MPDLAKTRFDDWFSGSKMLDESGSPMVLYHGTKSDFSSFDMKRFGASDEGLVGKGFYFTYNPEEASGYALNEQFGKGDGPNVMPVFLAIANPFVITQGVMPDGRKISDMHRGGISSKVGNGIRQMAEAAGHDGIVFANAAGQVRHAIAFRPEQIKSAIGNSGMFCKDDPNMCDRRTDGLLAIHRSHDATAYVNSLDAKACKAAP